MITHTCGWSLWVCGGLPTVVCWDVHLPPLLPLGRDSNLFFLFLLITTGHTRKGAHPCMALYGGRHEWENVIRRSQGSRLIDRDCRERESMVREKSYAFSSTSLSNITSLYSLQKFWDVILSHRRSSHTYECTDLFVLSFTCIFTCLLTMLFNGCKFWFARLFAFLL